MGMAQGVARENNYMGLLMVFFLFCVCIHFNQTNTFISDFLSNDFSQENDKRLRIDVHINFHITKFLVLINQNT